MILNIAGDTQSNASSWIVFLKSPQASSSNKIVRRAPLWVFIKFYWVFMFVIKLKSFMKSMKSQKSLCKSFNIFFDDQIDFPRFNSLSHPKRFSISMKSRGAIILFMLFKRIISRKWSQDWSNIDDAHHLTCHLSECSQHKFWLF